MTFSQRLWAGTEDIYQDILAHPFITQLANGSLSMQTFSYYIEQDGYYLTEYARALALIAARIEPRYIGTFLNYAQGAYVAEQTLVHDFFKQHSDFVVSDKLSPATLSYTHFLLKTCSLDEVAVAVATVLPCFWIYQKVGTHLAQQSNPDNRYQQWIDTYASDEFYQATQEALAIIDELATQSSEDCKQQMLRAYRLGCYYEWQFWEDSFQQASIGF